MTDTLHTNEERIEKIRCALLQVDTVLKNIQLHYGVHGLTSIRSDSETASQCLDALELFIYKRGQEDCI